MARLYANENFPRQAVEALRKLGHDVLTSAEAGMAGQAVTDQEVLAFARKHERAVITLNRRDFVRLHDKIPGHAGIIVCTQDPDTQGQAQRIDQAIMQAGSLSNRLIRVNRPSE